MMKIFRVLLLFMLTLCFSCKENIDISDIEVRDHGLRYIKNTGKLVDGQAFRKDENGNIVEISTYKKGKPVGDFIQFGSRGKIMLQGFGTEIKKYERLLNGTDLTYCILSVIELKNSPGFATLYMDNRELFEDREKLILLSKAIFEDYAELYPFDNLLLFDNEHEYTISKSAVKSSALVIDTIQKSDMERLRFH